MAKKPENRSQELRARAKHYEGRASAWHIAGFASSAAGIAGCILLGIYASRDDLPTQKLVLPSFLAAGLLPSATAYSRGRHFSRVAQRYHDQATTATSLEMTALAEANAYLRECAEDIVGTFVIDNGLVQRAVTREMEKRRLETSQPAPQTPSQPGEAPATAESVATPLPPEQPPTQSGA